MNARANFIRMEDSTKSDWDLIIPEAMSVFFRAEEFHL